MLNLHTKIKALSQRLGISYKDSAHRLYMAELERLKTADSAAKSFTMLSERINNIMTHEIAPAINAIDQWVFDDYILKDGRWEQKSE
jgi:hypothetical protein